LYYLIRVGEGGRFKVSIYKDIPEIKIKQGYRPPDPMLKICEIIERDDQIAFSAHSLMQYNFMASNRPQTKSICQKEYVDLWEKYYKVNKCFLFLFTLA